MQDRKSYDRTYAIVDLGRVVENLRLCKEKLRKGMAVCAVVKMDAYGHGIVEVAKAIEDECAMFGVATVEEAIILRKAGIEGDILILGVIPESQYALLYEYRIMPSLFTLKQLKKLEELGKKNNTNFMRVA